MMPDSKRVRVNKADVDAAKAALRKVGDRVLRRVGMVPQDDEGPPLDLLIEIVVSVAKEEELEFPDLVERLTEAWNRG